MQKKRWDAQIHTFLKDLVNIEMPVGYKYLGRPSGQRLQFCDYIGEKNMSEYISQLYDEIYDPRLVFTKQQFHIRFEDNWIIYIISKDVELLSNMMKLAAKNGLYFLPVYSRAHLNQYSDIEQALRGAGLQRAIYVKKN